jgi:succinate-acetate transporter protein
VRERRHPQGAGAFIPLAFFYGGLVQLLAGMWEFRNKNTFGATAFSSYGAFWMALGFFNYFPAELGVKGSPSALGITLVGWTVFTAYMWIASFRTTGVLLVIFGVLLITLVFLDVGVLHGSSFWLKAGGWAGLVTAAAAWYGSATGVVNHTFARQVLPTFPLNQPAR